MRASLFAASVAIVSQLCFASKSDGAPDPDIETVLERSRVIFGWPAADDIEAVVATAKQNANSLNATCYWPDIDYYDQNRANWLTFTHLGRVTPIIQAVTAPYSPVFEDAALLSKAHCALDVWLNRDFTNPNWWYQWIGVEVNLQSGFMMLGQNRTTAQEQAQLIEYSYNSAWWVNDYAGGANLINMIQVEIMRGAASGNESALSQGFTTMWANAVLGNVTANWQGVVNDNAYHFHGQQILSSAYGLDWLVCMLQFWSIAAGTKWAMPSQHVAVLAAFLAEGDAHLSFGSSWDWGTQGRGIDRPDSTFGWGLPIATVRALAAEPGAAPWRDQLLAYCNRLDGTSDTGNATQQLVGSKAFWTSDFYTHHRPTWGAALKMHGDNGLWTVVQNECDNSENLKGEHTGDGVLNVYASVEPSVAAEAYANIFPLLDWNAINGITVEHDTPIETCTQDTGDVFAVRNTAFVGGCTDGMYGIAVMDSATHNTTSQRSWLFFDDAIIALASNLTNSYGFIPRASDVWTTLISRILPSPVADPTRGSVTVGMASNSSVGIRLADGNYSWNGGDVAWISAGGIGYLPSLPLSASSVPAPVDATAATVGLRVGNTTGTWQSIGAFDGTVTARVITAWLDHGSELPPASAATTGYAYAIIPNTTATDMPSIFSNTAGVICITADVDVHGAVQYNPSAAAGQPLLVASAAFWSMTATSTTAFTCQDPSLPTDQWFYVTSSAQAIVTTTQYGTGAGATLTVTAAHPASYMLGAMVNVTVFGRAATGAGCSPAPGGNGTVFSVQLPAAKDYMGMSTSVGCTLVQ